MTAVQKVDVAASFLEMKKGCILHAKNQSWNHKTLLTYL